MGCCGCCVYAPEWESDEPDAKGICTWGKTFQGLGFPSGLKPWFQYYEDFPSLISNMMQPITRNSGQSCAAFKCASEEQVYS